MSTEVTVSNPDELQQGMADVRNDATEINWLLVGHENSNPAVIEFLGCGEGGVEEFASHLDDARVMYGLVRLTETIDMSLTIKFVYITWFGKDVSFVKRGKYGVVSGSVEKFFSPYQVSVTFDGESKSDVTQETLMSKIQETSGTKNKVLDAAEGKTRPERGFVASSTTPGRTGPMSPTGGPVKMGKQGSQFSGFTSQAKGGSNIGFNDDVSEALAAVRSDEDEKTWMVAKFPNNDVRKPLQVLQSGVELSDLSPLFVPEDIALALIRVTDVVDDIPTVKFVYILWVGEGVKPMSKGRLPTAKGMLEEKFAPFHVHIQASTANEIRPQVILDKVGGASGSKSNVK